MAFTNNATSNIAKQDEDKASEIPIIDLSNPDKSQLQHQLYQACSTWGFFQLINHRIPTSTISNFQHAMSNFFALPYETKVKLKRSANNARGYFDDELTKRRRDWKECLDVGMPGSRVWRTANATCRDDGINNETTSIKDSCLDGWNQLPNDEECPNFATVVIQYFDECARLSNQLAVLMARALGVEEGSDDEKLLQRMVNDHTSYLRMNYYPPCDSSTTQKATSSSNNNSKNEPPPLGISPHRDAGFLTILLQDDDCHSLQVARFEDEDHRDDDDDCWMTVHPVPGSLTINTGDMAMIWSNGKFRAPLHRVLTDPSKKRYSAPFFYNPGYKELISPLACCCHQMDNVLDDIVSYVGDTSLEEKEEKSSDGNCNSCCNNNNNANKIASLGPMKYQPCLWGYFRAVRFAGDITDLGVEIQTSHFKVGSSNTSTHVQKQSRFMEEVNFKEPFDVEKYRHILESKDD